MADRSRTVGQVNRLDVSIERGATFEQNFIYRHKPSIVRPIQRIDRANPGKVLCENHKFDSGDVVFLSGLMGMSEVENRAFTITVVDANYFTLGENTSGYHQYLSGGTADDGEPYDLTAYDAIVNLMTAYGETPFLTLTLANDGIVLGDATGMIQWIITDEQTAAIAVDNCVYTFDVMPGDGTRKRLLYGAVAVSR